MNSAAKGETEFENSAAMLAGHSTRVALDEARQMGASPDVLAAMLCKLARVHRMAADRLDRAALRAKLGVAR